MQAVYPAIDLNRGGVRGGVRGGPEGVDWALEGVHFVLLCFVLLCFFI
jgi:hypothetical protein